MKTTVNKLYTILVFLCVGIIFSSCQKENIVVPPSPAGIYQGSFVGTYTYKGKVYSYEHYPIMRVYITPDGPRIVTIYNQNENPATDTYLDILASGESRFGGYFYYSNYQSLQKGTMHGQYYDRDRVFEGTFTASTLIELPPSQGGGFVEVPVDGTFHLDWQNR